MHRRSLGLLGIAALGIAGLHCGSSASSASPSGGGSGFGPVMGGLGGHVSWGGGPDGNVAMGGAGTNPATQNGASATSGAATSSGAGGASGMPTIPAACANFPTTATVLDLSIPRARATASPVIARGILQGTKNAPPPAQIDAMQFLNYYPPSYTSGTSLAPQVGVANGAITGEYLLQIGVQAPSAPVRGDKTTITAVVDTSTAMLGGGMDRARAALEALLASLHPGDTLNVTTSNTGDGTGQSQTFRMSADDASALAFIKGLAVDGGDDLGGGLVNGYLAANQTFAGGGLNRLVLITAGSPPPGSVDLGLIAGQAQRGILLVGVGVGPASTYDDTLLAQATFAGNGADVYLDTPDEADAILHERFDEVMDVAASAVEVEVEVPAGIIVENTGSAASDQDAGGADAGGSRGLAVADLGPGRPMIFRLTLLACQSLATLGDVQVSVSYHPTPGGVKDGVPPFRASIPNLLQQTPAQIAKASAVLAYADALSGLNADRVAYAIKLAGDAAFDADPDFADPMSGIRALLALEQQRVP